MTREAVATEGVEGGFAGIYPDPADARGGRPDPARLLRRRAGSRPVRARRGDSSGCARSASRRGSPRRTRDVYLLAAADPANPYGAAVAWPRRGEDDRRPLQRAAGRLRRDRRRRRRRSTWSAVAGRSRRCPPRTTRRLPTRALRSLVALVADRRIRELVITKVDGGPVGESPFRDAARAGSPPASRPA